MVQQNILLMFHIFTIEMIYEWYMNHLAMFIYVIMISITHAGWRCIQAKWYVLVENRTRDHWIRHLSPYYIITVLPTDPRKQIQKKCSVPGSIPDQSIIFLVILWKQWQPWYGKQSIIKWWILFNLVFNLHMICLWQYHNIFHIIICIARC